MRVAINGYGRVARALISHWKELESPPSIVLVRNSSHQWRGENFQGQSLMEEHTKLDQLEDLKIDCWFELTPAREDEAKEIHTQLMELTDRGVSLIIANKVPLLYDYKALKDSADKNRVLLGLSGVLGAALPSQALVHYGTLGSKIISMEAILNGTTNFILTAMEEGLSFEEALKKAQEMGIAETDPIRDIQGFDSAIKMALLASVVRNQNIFFEKEDVQGIKGISLKRIEEEKINGRRLRLVASFRNEKVKVELKSYTMDHGFYHTKGSQKALMLETSQLSQILLVGGDSGLKEFAASLHRDLLWIEEIQNLTR